MTLVPTGPRDLRDAKRLAELEQTIESGMVSFVAVGTALLEVRDSKLYRVGYETFEAYCKGRWGFSRPRAYQLMEAAETVGAIEAVSTTVDIPTERAARELGPVLRDHGPDVAAAVMAEASANGAPTAESIRAAATPFRPRLDPAPDPYFAPKTDGALALAPEPEQWAPSPALMSSDSAEWYTPKRVLDAVVATLGAIDLDPCADPERSVPAATHYTLEDDGLAREWTGRVYMNPPYGRAIVEWIAKLAASFRAELVTEAVALVPGRTETDWFAALDADWQCQVHGRLAFSDHETSAPFPSVAVYLGPRGEAFTAAFSSLGDVFERRGRYPR